MTRGGQNIGAMNRERRAREIAVHTLNELLDFRLDPNKPVAEMVRMKMKIRKTLDDIRKLDNDGTAT